MMVVQSFGIAKIYSQYGGEALLVLKLEEV
jgi:hypothetical protein